MRKGGSHVGRVRYIHAKLALVLLFSSVSMRQTEGKKLHVEGSSPDEGMDAMISVLKDERVGQRHACRLLCTI